LSRCKVAKYGYDVNLYIGGKKITKVSSYKYLGMFMDERLLWEDHIDYIYMKVVKFTSIFYKVRYLLHNACLKNLYFAFIYRHILFGIEIYANTCKTRLDKLSKLNNKIIRILFLLNKKITTPVFDLYKIMNVLPMAELYRMKLLQFVYTNVCFTKNCYQNFFFSVSTLS